MEINRKLDDSYRVLIPIEIRNQLDINKYEPLTMEFDENTKKITINFDKYKKKSVTSVSKVKKILNPAAIEPLESVTTKLIIRKRNLVTIPNPVFQKLRLATRKYNVYCTTNLDTITLCLYLSDKGTYKYRKECVLCFSEINTYFNLKIKEGVSCNFRYKSDGTLEFTFNSTDIIEKELEHKEISLEERLRGT